MNYYENPKLASVYLERVRDMMEGRRSMPPVAYNERGSEFHLSDFDLCPLPSFFKRAMTLQPKFEDESILVFLRGRIVERAMAKETDPICVDGIWMTVDDAEPPEPFKVVEIKSTEWGMHFFDPPKNSPQWMERGMGYCHGYGVTEMGLVVFFLSGNKSDFQSWQKDRRPPKGTPKIGAAITAWTFEFTPEEVAANWKEILRRRDVLQTALDSGEPMSDKEVLERRPEWQCKKCQYRGMCHIIERKEFGVPAVV